MAETYAQPARPPAMDYAGHESWMFIQVRKYTAIGAALILAMLACFRG